MSESVQDQSASAKIPNPANELATRYWKYVLDNPIKSVAATILSWGGLLLLMFFLRIGFMPDVNLESVSSLLYAVALFGGFIAAYSALLMVLPGLAMAELRATIKFLKFRHLVATEIGAVLSWAAFLFCSFDYIPLWVAWTICIINTILIPLVCLVVDRHRSTVLITPSTRSIKKPEAPAPKFCERRLKRLNVKWSNRGWDEAKIIQAIECQRLRRRWPTYLWTACMVGMNTTVLAPSLLFIGVIGLTGDIRTASALPAIFLLTTMTLMIALSGAMIGNIRSSERFKIAAVIAPVLLLLVMLITGSFSAFSVIAVKSLGQGEINAARIAVTGKTCKEVNQTLGQRVCADVADGEITAICPVRVRSRIGSQVLLEFAPMTMKTDESGVGHALWVTSMEVPTTTSGSQRERSLIHRVVLEKSKMLGWQPLQAFSEVSSSDEASPPVASFVVRTRQAGDTSAAAEADSLRRVLHARCGENVSSPQSVPASKASDEVSKEP